MCRVWSGLDMPYAPHGRNRSSHSKFKLIAAVVGVFLVCHLLSVVITSAQSTAAGGPLILFPLALLWKNNTSNPGLSSYMDVGSLINVQVCALPGFCFVSVYSPYSASIISHNHMRYTYFRTRSVDQAIESLLHWKQQQCSTFVFIVFWMAYLFTTKKMLRRNDIISLFSVAADLPSIRLLSKRHLRQSQLIDSSMWRCVLTGGYRCRWEWCWCYQSAFVGKAQDKTITE